MSSQQHEGGKINLNKAGKEDLVKLPGVGPKIAEKIIQYRKEHGTFQNKEEILKVSGLGKSKLRDLENIITIYDNKEPNLGQDLRMFFMN